MTRARMAVGFGLVLLVAGCADNVAPGNDREAALDPSAAPAEVVDAGAAIDGVATGLLMPQIMTEPDVAGLPDGGRCVFRMTRVGYPVLVYGSTAVIKLNDRLVRLPAAGEGSYAEAGVSVTVRPLGEETGDDAFPAELVLRLPGSPNELGFHGYAEC